MIATIITLIVLTGLICLPLNNYYQQIQYKRETTALMSSILTLTFLVVLSLGAAFSFDVSRYELCSNIFLAYATRHIVFCVYSLLLNSSNPDLLIIRINQQNFINYLIYFLIYGFFIISITLLVHHDKRRKRLSLETPMFVILTVTIVLNTFILSLAEVVSDEHLLSYSYVLLSQILTLSLIIILNFFAQHQIDLKLNNQLSLQLLKKQEDQYKFAKANAELMYVKAHDLKHQVAILRKGGEEAEKILCDLESVISNYDSVTITDNSVMNIILSEKWQYCSKHNIKLSCTVDPSALIYMENLHLYTLLANILDNAIEAVMKIKNKDKRLISLTISNKKGLSIIQAYNYFEGDIVLKDGFPETDKKTKGLHGFGFKSIHHIVEIYNGELSFESDKDIFNLQIIIPNEK